MINSLAIGITLGLIVIGVIGILVSGVINIINGKSEFKRIAVMLVPVVIFGISYATLGTLDQAGVATVVLMVAVMMISIFVTGTRGTIKF
jgi:hypothetical protein